MDTDPPGRFYILFFRIHFILGGCLHGILMGAAQEAVVAVFIEANSRLGVNIFVLCANPGMGVGAIDRACEYILQSAAFRGAARNMATILASGAMHMICSAIATVGRHNGAIFLCLIAAECTRSLVLIIHPIFAGHVAAGFIAASTENTGCRVSAVAIGCVSIGTSCRGLIMVTHGTGDPVGTVYICLVGIDTICTVDSVVTLSARNIVHRVSNVRIG